MGVLRGHTYSAHSAGEYERCLGRRLLIVTFGLLHLRLLLGVFLLGLNLLMPSCHAGNAERGRCKDRILMHEQSVSKQLITVIFVCKEQLNNTMFAHKQ